MQLHTHRGGGVISCWDYFAGKILEGDILANLANAKAYNASRTHCTAKAPRFRQGKISPSALKTKFSHDIIPPTL